MFEQADLELEIYLRAGPSSIIWTRVLALAETISDFSQDIEICAIALMMK